MFTDRLPYLNRKWQHGLLLKFVKPRFCHLAFRTLNLNLRIEMKLNCLNLKHYSSLRNTTLPTLTSTLLLKPIIPV